MRFKEISLLIGLVVSALLASPTSALAEGDDIFAGLGAGAILADGHRDVGAFVVRVDLVRYQGENVEVEPVYYIPRFSGQFPLANFQGRSGLSNLNLEFTPIGVSMEEGDNSLRGEAAHVAYSRDYALDEKTVFKVSVLRGVARKELPFLRSRGKRNFFVQVMIDAVGYKLLERLSDVDTFHGLRLGMIGGEAGISLYPASPFAVKAVIGGSIDFNVTPTLAATVQSDAEAYGAIRFERKGSFHSLVKASLKRSSTSGLDVATPTSREVLLGVNYIF